MTQHWLLPEYPVPVDPDLGRELAAAATSVERWMLHVGPTTPHIENRFTWQAAVGRAWDAEVEVRPMLRTLRDQDTSDDQDLLAAWAQCVGVSAAMYRSRHMALIRGARDLARWVVGLSGQRNAYMGGIAEWRKTFVDAELEAITATESDRPDATHEPPRVR